MLSPLLNPFLPPLPLFQITASIWHPARIIGFSNPGQDRQKKQKKHYFNMKQIRWLKLISLVGWEWDEGNTVETHQNAKIAPAFFCAMEGASRESPEVGNITLMQQQASCILPFPPLFQKILKSAFCYSWKTDMGKVPRISDRVDSYIMISHGLFNHNCYTPQLAGFRQRAKP